MALVYKSAQHTYIQGIWGNSYWTFKFYVHFLRHPAIVFCMHCAVVRADNYVCKMIVYIHALTVKFCVSVQWQNTPFISSFCFFLAVVVLFSKRCWYLLSQIIKVNMVMIIDSEKTVISGLVLSRFTSSQDKLNSNEFVSKIVSLTLDRELQPAQAAARGSWVLFISTTAEPGPEQQQPSDQSGQSWSSRSWLVSGDRSPYGDTTTGAFSVIKWPISTLAKLHQIV